MFDRMEYLTQNSFYCRACNTGKYSEKLIVYRQKF